MRDAIEIEETIDRYADTVWRVCGLYFRDPSDRQDVFQDVFLKFAMADSTAFTDEEHIKAWLIKVTRTTCLDQLKRAHRRKAGMSDAPIEELAVEASSQPGSFEQEVRDALVSLDDPPRTPLYLALFEGYPAPEIARMLDAPVNTVYSWISRGKARLKERLS